MLMISTSKINGQRFDKNNFLDRWSITASSGITIPWCDAEANWKGNFKENPAFGLTLTKEMNSLFELRLEAIKGSLRGYQPTHNRDFIANTFELNLAGTIDFTRLSFGPDPCRSIIVHGIFGFGFYNYSGILRAIDDNEILYSTGYDTKGNKIGYKTEPVLNSGINVKIKMSRLIFLVFENTWTITGNDYLDGHVGGFRYDIYSYTSFGITYRFNFRTNGRYYSNCRGGSTQ